MTASRGEWQNIPIFLHRLRFWGRRKQFIVSEVYGILHIHIWVLREPLRKFLPADTFNWTERSAQKPSHCAPINIPCSTFMIMCWLTLQLYTLVPDIASKLMLLPSKHFIGPSSDRLPRSRWFCWKSSSSNFSSLYALSCGVADCTCPLFEKCMRSPFMEFITRNSCGNCPFPVINHDRSASHKDLWL